jgi:hypothetical protein
MSLIKELLLEMNTKSVNLNPLTDNRFEFNKRTKTLNAPEPMLFDTVYIAQHFLSALIDGDNSGLDDEDEQLLNNWYASMQQETGSETLIFQPRDEHPELEIDDVTGKRAECVAVDIYFYE